MKIGLNNTDDNDQGAFDAVNNHFLAPVDGTYLFGATLAFDIRDPRSVRRATSVSACGVGAIDSSPIP
jgi:hypothetical protein